MRNILSIITLSLTLTLFACGGSAPAPEVDPSNNAAEQTTEQTPEAAAEQPAEQPAEPISPEATEMGAAPQESLLTEENRFDISAVMRENRETLTACYDDNPAVTQDPADGTSVEEFKVTYRYKLVMQNTQDGDIGIIFVPPRTVSMREKYLTFEEARETLVDPDGSGSELFPVN